MMAKKKEKGYELITGDKWEETGISVPMGNPLIDKLIGGGIPTGACVEIFGEWSTGKSVLAWTLAREAQKLGGFTLLVETESAFRKSFAEKCGLDLTKLKMLTHTREQPITVPIFFEVAEIEMRKAQRYYPFSVIILDSLAALNSAARTEDGKESYGKHYMADVARQMAQGLNRFKGLLKPWNGILVIINQVRDNVGVLFGNKQTTPGGKAVRFYSDLRVLLHNPKKEVKNKEDTGILVGFYVAKSKLAKPFGKAQIRIDFEKGLDPNYGVEETEES